MKKTKFATATGAILALTLLIAARPGRAATAIDWVHEYEPAMKSAADGHKLVLVEFYFDT
jgi:hypothetical protein